MKRFGVIIFTLALLSLGVLVGCGPFEVTARNSIAAFQGALVQAQQKHTAECLASKGSLPVCDVLTRASFAENAAVTALETYCSQGPHSDPKTPCVEAKDAKGVLVAALQNLQRISGELKGAAQ